MKPNIPPEPAVAQSVPHPSNSAPHLSGLNIATEWRQALAIDEFADAVDLSRFVSILKKECLGNGGYGSVYKAVWNKIPSLYRGGVSPPEIAIKIFRGTYHLSEVERQKFSKVSEIDT